MILGSALQSAQVTFDAQVFGGVKAAGGIKAKLFMTGYAAKQQGLKNGHVTHFLWDKLVFGKIAKKLGLGECKVCRATDIRWQGGARLDDCTSTSADAWPSGDGPGMEGGKLGLTESEPAPNTSPVKAEQGKRGGPGFCLNGKIGRRLLPPLPSSPSPSGCDNKFLRARSKFYAHGKRFPPHARILKMLGI